MRDSEIKELYAMLRENLHYDPDTGVFTWLTGGRNRNIGDRAGVGQKSGYRRIHLGRRTWMDAQLAYLYMTGELSSYMGRHDKDPSNCKYANLYASKIKVVHLTRKAKTDKHRIMKALDGDPMSVNSLAEKLRVNPQCVRPPLQELIDNGYVIKKNFLIHISARGHQDLFRDGRFYPLPKAPREKMMYLFQKALPGTLTGSESERGHEIAQKIKQYGAMAVR